mmetsp:Transcript_58227/g.118402  ORF Transcript_58227/g.118402 Transcript_58227/m.118402 type:complete len:203 (+) Transcript_58227:163-771(+)
MVVVQGGMVQDHADETSTSPLLLRCLARRLSHSVCNPLYDGARGADNLPYGIVAILYSEAQDDACEKTSGRAYRYDAAEDEAQGSAAEEAQLLRDLLPLCLRRLQLLLHLLHLLFLRRSLSLQVLDLLLLELHVVPKVVHSVAQQRRRIEILVLARDHRMGPHNLLELRLGFRRGVHIRVILRYQLLVCFPRLLGRGACAYA